MDLKVGDKVTVHAKVGALAGIGDVMVDFLATTSGGDVHLCMWISKDQISTIEPRPITVGDIVRHQSCGWLVKGIEGDNLWLRRGYDGVYKAVFSSEVQRSSSKK